MSEQAPDDKTAADSAEEKDEGRRESEDLQVEHWQAPKPDRMKADSREIWEFESEKTGPSRALWFNLALTILALALGLALIFYGIYRLSAAAGTPGPELP